MARFDRREGNEEERRKVASASEKRASEQKKDAMGSKKARRAAQTAQEVAPRAQKAATKSKPTVTGRHSNINKEKLGGLTLVHEWAIILTTWANTVYAKAFYFVQYFGSKMKFIFSFFMCISLPQTSL